MARNNSKILTEREAPIMEILWDMRSATAEEVRKRLPGDLHDSTVRTLLRILESKGYAKHIVRERTYVYRPALTRRRAQRKAVSELIKRFFGGSPDALVLRLLDDEQITPEQLEQLKEPSSKSPVKPTKRRRS